MRKFDKKMQALQWPAHFFCYVTVKLPSYSTGASRIFSGSTDRFQWKVNGIIKNAKTFSVSPGIDTMDLKLSSRSHIIIFWEFILFLLILQKDQ